MQINIKNHNLLIYKVFNKNIISKLQSNNFNSGSFISKDE